MPRKQIAIRLLPEELDRVKVVAEANQLSHCVWMRQTLMLAVAAAEEAKKNKEE